MEKYRKGWKLANIDAIGLMVAGHVVFRNDLPSRINRDGEFECLTSSGWSTTHVSPYNEYFQAIKEPEFNMTFAEAMAYLRGGSRRVVRCEQWESDITWDCSTDEALLNGCSYTVDGPALDRKYAVVK